MIYGYARCSTNEKMQDINRQVRELKQQGATDTTIYLEYESGMKADRVELQKLLDIVQSGDTIIATEVSRITRSTKQLCDIIELAKNKHIKLVLGTFVVDCSKVKICNRIGLNYEKSNVTGNRELPGHLPDYGLEGVQRTRRRLRFPAHQGHRQSPGTRLCHPGGFSVSAERRGDHAGQHCSCRLQTGNLTFLDDHHPPNCKSIFDTQ